MRYAFRVRRVALAGRREAGGREVALERAGGGHRHRRGRRVRRPRCCRRARAGAGPDRASRTRCPRASRASRRGASSARSRGAVAPSAVRGWRAPACRSVGCGSRVCSDISLRYIGVSIHTVNGRVDIRSPARLLGPAGDPRRTARPGRRVSDPCTLAPCAGTPTTRWPDGPCSATCERGTVARLDVCDAHPELLRAARHVGEPADHRVPGLLGPPRPLRLLRLRRPAAPGQRPLHRPPERARAPRRRARRVRPLRGRGLPRLRVELPHPARAPRPPPRRRTGVGGAGRARSTVARQRSSQGARGRIQRDV